MSRVNKLAKRSQRHMTSLDGLGITLRCKRNISTERLWLNAKSVTLNLIRCKNVGAEADRAAEENQSEAVRVVAEYNRRYREAMTRMDQRETTTRSEWVTRTNKDQSMADHYKSFCARLEQKCNDWDEARASLDF